MINIRICYSYYVLDIPHRGHLNYMENARAIAGMDGVSVVGILTDEAVMERKPRPVVSFDERIELARALGNGVVIPQETYSPLDNIKRLHPDIVVESSSHSEEDIYKIREYMKKIGGRVIVFPYYPGQSSSHIKNKIKENNGNTS